MNTAIYIQSHNRSQQARALVKKLQHTFPSIPIYVCIEPEQRYSSIKCKKLVLPESGRGIGYAKKKCGEHALANGYTTFILLDDDSVVPDNLLQLAQNLEEHPEIAWCAGHMPFYTANGLKPLTGLYYAYLMGNNIVAINTKKLDKVGGFDAALRAKECDHTKMKLMDRKYYCSIDTDVLCSKIIDNLLPPTPSLIKDAGQLLRGYWGHNYIEGDCLIKWNKMNRSNIFSNINLSELPREAKPMITVTAEDIPKDLMTGKTMLAYPIPWGVATELGEKYEGIHYFDKMTKGLFYDEDENVTLENSMKVLATKKFSLMVFNEIPTQGRIETLSKSLEQNGIMLMPAPRSGKPESFTKMMKKINLKPNKEHTNDLFNAWVRA